jgi:8-oxo-dGTP diphosphatase
LANDRGAWAGKLNGVGGHIEQGEDPTSAAKREILEETGYSPDSLQLTGMVIVDIGIVPGISLYVYAGKVHSTNPPLVNDEGTLEWIQLSELQDSDLVEDLPLLIPKSLESYEQKSVFSALYFYDNEGSLNIKFHD